MLNIFSRPGSKSGLPAFRSAMAERDIEGVMLRLLCEKAEHRLEQAWAASEIAHRTVQLPSGNYYWAKETDEEKPLQSR